VLIAAAGLLYALVRGLTSDRVAEAFDNAGRVIRLERAVGLFVEVDLQRAVIGHDLLARAANTVYVWGYWPVLVGTLGWLLARHPAAYPFYRNALLASGGLSLAVFALFPLAPPRFLPEHGFVDTIATGAAGYRSLNSPALVNEYAAMPSLHFGWILLLGIAWLSLGRSTALRAAGVMLPAAMFATIVATGNHYILDGLVGGAVVLWGLAVATALRRRSGTEYRLPVVLTRRPPGSPPGPLSWSGDEQRGVDDTPEPVPGRDRLRRPGPAPRTVAGAGRSGLRGTHADPAGGDPAATPGTGPARPSGHRHR
jgi:hypothetical protein